MVAVFQGKEVSITNRYGKIGAVQIYRSFASGQFSLIVDLSHIIVKIHS